MSPYPPLTENTPLASHTTLGVGGPARYFAEYEDETRLRELLTFAQEGGHPLLILGGGSNLLVSDRGFEGLVIRPRSSGLRVEESSDRVGVWVSAGHDWDALVAFAVERGWAGIECLSGIPGQAGAAPMQNIGANGQEVAECLRAVRVLEIASGEDRWIAAEDCAFGYRTSHFKTTWQGRYVILELELALTPDGVPTVRKADLQARLQGRLASAEPSLQEVRNTTLELRREKSMLLEDSNPNRRSAGSFFTNPVVEAELADQVAEQAARLRPDRGSMPRFAQSDGRAKLSAAWLIETAGFSRGYQRGPAGLSTAHVLALVNRGEAKAADLVALALQVKRTVTDTFGVTLTPEPVLVGFEPEEIAELTG
jgi:UDP-N-acetylmuramate dehydrogenase